MNIKVWSHVQNLIGKLLNDNIIPNIEKTISINQTNREKMGCAFEIERGSRGVNQRLLEFKEKKGKNGDQGKREVSNIVNGKMSGVQNNQVVPILNKERKISNMSGSYKGKKESKVNLFIKGKSTFLDRRGTYVYLGTNKMTLHG